MGARFEHCLRGPLVDASGRELASEQPAERDEGAAEEEVDDEEAVRAVDGAKAEKARKGVSDVGANGRVGTGTTVSPSSVCSSRAIRRR
jgi:hypothetical protein